jgi:hypothetical protein
MRNFEHLVVKTLHTGIEYADEPSEDGSWELLGYNATINNDPATRSNEDTLEAAVGGALIKALNINAKRQGPAPPKPEAAPAKKREW